MKIGIRNIAHSRSKSKFHGIYKGQVSFYSTKSADKKYLMWLQYPNLDLSDLTCACNTRTCEDNTCISRKPNGCSYKRTGLIITGRSCADTSYILYSEDSSNHEYSKLLLTSTC